MTRWNICQNTFSLMHRSGSMAALLVFAFLQFFIVTSVEAQGTTPPNTGGSTTALPKYRLVLPYDESKNNILLAFEFINETTPVATKGQLSTNAIYLTHNQEVTLRPDPVFLTNTWAGQSYYTPGVAIEVDGRIYYTDARYVVNPSDSKTYFDQNFNKYQDLLMKFNQSEFSSTKPYYVHKDQYRAEATSLAGYQGGGYKAPPASASGGSTAQGTDAAGSGTSSGGGSGQAPVVTRGMELATPGGGSNAGTGGSGSSGVGNDLSIDMASDAELASSGTPTDLSNVPIPRPRPPIAQYSAEASEGISLRVSEELQAQMISNNGEVATGNINIVRETPLKIVPDGQKKIINGETWREVEYVFGFDRRRLLIPQSKLLTVSGPLKDDSLVRTADVAAAEAARRTEAESQQGADVAGGGSQSSETPPATGDSAPSTGTTTTTTADDGRATPSEESLGANEVPVSACANPEYLSYLSNQNPNCRLIKANKLVRSSLREGDVVLAMNKNSKVCYKLSVGMMSYTDDRLLNTEIERVTRGRKDSFEELSRFLQNGHVGFVSMSEPARNRFTVSCHDRTNICSLGFGFEAAQRVPHVKTFTTPSTGLVSDPSKDLKIQIYGPSPDGLYMVRHMRGNTPGRVFLVSDASKIREAIRMMDQHTRKFSDLRLSEEDKNKALSTKPVLYTQLGDATGDKQTRTIDLDPRQPFKAIADLNASFDYYNMSCKREDYNPLLESSEGTASDRSRTSSPSSSAGGVE